jgi:hypothetical protein
MAVAEWDAQRRSEHARRLRRAAAKAVDKAAARKMMAMARHEQQSSRPGPVPFRAGQLAAPGRMSSWRPPSLSEEELREEREWALADRHADMRHAKVDTPWQCLLLSFHALFGCDHALR